MCGCCMPLALVARPASQQSQSKACVFRHTSSYTSFLTLSLFFSVFFLPMTVALIITAAFTPAARRHRLGHRSAPRSMLHAARWANPTRIHHHWTTCARTDWPGAARAAIGGERRKHQYCSGCIRTHKLARFLSQLRAALHTIRRSSGSVRPQTYAT